MQMLGSNEAGDKILDGREKEGKPAVTTDGAGGEAQKQNGATEVRLPSARASLCRPNIVVPWPSNCLHGRISHKPAQLCKHEHNENGQSSDEQGHATGLAQN